MGGLCLDFGWEDVEFVISTSEAGEADEVAPTGSIGIIAVGVGRSDCDWAAFDDFGGFALAKNAGIGSVAVVVDDDDRLSDSTVVGSLGSSANRHSDGSSLGDSAKSSIPTISPDLWNARSDAMITDRCNRRY